MFKRKRKTDERAKRQLEEELEVTTYEEDLSDDISEETVDTSQSTKPDDGYPEIGPSYQPSEEEDTVQEPLSVLEEDTPEDDTQEEPVYEMEDEGQLEQEPIIEDTEHTFEEEPIEAISDDEVLDQQEEPVEDEEIPSGWQWADVDDDNRNDEEEPLQAPDFILEDIPEEEDSPMVQEFTLPTKDKVDLNHFFEASKEQKKLKRREKKQYSRKELKRRKKRQSRSRVPEDIRDQKVFLFRKKRYKTVEDFIQYLNDHYLDIDDVARDVLADENFFGFVGKKSGVFPQSLQEFREIKKKIEGNE